LDRGIAHDWKVNEMYVPSEITHIPQVAAIDSVIHLNYACGSVLVQIYALPVGHLFVLLRSI
jgi:hypothetical protein